MKFDARLNVPLADAGAVAKRYQDIGYSGAWVAEVTHDPFLAALASVQATDRLQVGTSIAVAFARNPMTVAMAANDLHCASGGRFLLGLGTQVKAHIERRYSMPWSAPAARMREYILALRAIWEAWNEGTPLAFRGEFYRHDLMTPFFRPDPNPHGTPPIMLAGVGPIMTEVAGSVADGFICHAFTTETYLREVTVPALARARSAVGRDMSDFEIYGSFFVVAGADDEAFAAARRATKRQIAFYASTPAYRGVLELHGWQDVQPELNDLARADRWHDMEGLISDEMLAAFAVVAELKDAAKVLEARFGDIVTRASIYLTGDPDPELESSIVREVLDR